MMRLILAVSAARLVYLVWFCPYELVADEAQYWDWSRRLGASYYSKGPGTPWLIAASTFLFGVHPWAVRLPAVAASALSALAVGRLAAAAYGRPLVPAAVGNPRPGRSDTPRDPARVALSAAALFFLAPPFQLYSFIMTIDGPYFACWALAAWAGWRALAGPGVFHHGPRAGDQTGVRWGAWLGLGAAVGIGFLFKYTILLLLPGLALYAWFERTRSRFEWRGMLLAGAVFGLAAAPVLAWNVEHGGAGLRHLLGYLHASGGDRPVSPIHYDPRWTLAYLASLVGMFGPLLGLVGLAVVRHLGLPATDPDRRATLYMICCAAPMLAGFLVASVRTDIEANWTLAAFTTLIASAGAVAADLTRAAGGRREQEDERRRRATSRWLFGTALYGLLAAVVIHAPAVAAATPLVGAVVPMHRLTGFERRARTAENSLDALRARHGEEPLIIAGSHNEAGLLAFYLNGRPPVANAGPYLGNRVSSYEFFADVDLERPAVLGRPAYLFGAPPELWSQAFELEGLEPLPGDREGLAAARFLGPRSPLVSDLRRWHAAGPAPAARRPLP